MSTLGGAKPVSEKPVSASETQSQMTARLEDFRSVSKKLMNSTSTMSSAVEDDDEEDDSESGEATDPPQHIHAEAARLLGRRLSDAVMTPLSNPSKELAAPLSQPPDLLAAANAGVEKPGDELVTTHLISPANLAAQLYANPKLAALRSSSFGSSTQTPSHSATQPRLPAASPPIIMNPKCSGYFVEPVRPFSINSSRPIS
jgi:dual specificity phosphatase 12